MMTLRRHPGCLAATVLVCACVGVMPQAFGESAAQVPSDDDRKVDADGTPANHPSIVEGFARPSSAQTLIRQGSKVSESLLERSVKQTPGQTLSLGLCDGS